MDIKLCFRVRTVLLTQELKEAAVVGKVLYFCPLQCLSKVHPVVASMRGRWVSWMDHGQFSCFSESRLLIPKPGHHIAGALTGS